MNIRVSVFLDDFLEVWVDFRRREKCGDGRTQGICGHQFGWRERRVHGAEPASERAPYFGGMVDRQVLQQPLGNASQLDVRVKGAHLSANPGTVGIACTV